MNEEGKKNENIAEFKIKKDDDNISEFRVKSDSGDVIVNIEKFIKFASIQKEIKIGKDFTITMKTLTNKERNKATSSVKFDPSISMTEYIEAIKIPILSASIVKINDVVFNSDEDKKRLAEYLDKAQETIVDRLWLEYNKLISEQYELLENEELKKK